MESVMFFCLFFVTLSNYQFFENGNAIKPCNFQYNYGAIAHRKVSSCVTIFNFLYWPRGFSPRGNFIPWRFWGLYSHNGEIRRKVADLGPPPMVNFVKVAEGNPSLMGKCKPKITNLDDFWGSKCTFLKLHRCNLTWGWGPGSPSHRAKFCIKNRLREFDPYGQIYTHFGDFELLKPTFFTLIMLKFDFISQRHKIVSESLKGLHGLPVLHWLGGDAYLFLQCSYYLCQGGGYAINAVCLWFVRSLSVIPPVCRITKISLINRFHQNETWSYTWAYQSEELLTFGGDLVSGTNSLPSPLRNRGF